MATNKAFTTSGYPITILYRHGLRFLAVNEEKLKTLAIDDLTQRQLCHLVSEQEGLDMPAMLIAATRGEVQLLQTIFNCVDSQTKWNLLTELFLNLSVAGDQEDLGMFTIKGLLCTFERGEMLELLRNMSWHNMRGEGIYQRSSLLLNTMESDAQRYATLTSSTAYNEYRTKVHQAVLSHNNEVLRAMLHSVDEVYRYKLLQITDGYRHTPLHDAIWSRDDKILKIILSCLSSHDQRFKLLTMYDSDGAMPLARAAMWREDNLVAEVKSSLSPAEWYSLLTLDNPYTSNVSHIMNNEKSNFLEFKTEARVMAVIEDPGWCDSSFLISKALVSA